MDPESLQSEIDNCESVRNDRLMPLVPSFLALYAVAVGMLAWHLGTRPDFPYNWESYTLRGLIDFVEHPTADVFVLNDGLMTDSGRSGVVVGPTWLGFKIIGQSFMGLRLPLAMIAALSVPLTWLLGRRLYSDAVGMTGALLVLTSQVFLLYARTGTIVGMSITPALIGMLILWQCLGESRRWMWWVVALQAVLIICSYFYAPIRFLWLIAAVLFAVEVLFRHGQRRRFLIALALTAAMLPIVATLLRPGPLSSPWDAVVQYYYGRGEQIFYLNENPSEYEPFLNADSGAAPLSLDEESPDELAQRLVRKNLGDLANLLLDRQTRPAITDFWNPEGRLYPVVLAPFFLLGALVLVIRFFREPRARFLLALFCGFSLPLLLTSRVHIGRLIFIVPLLALIVALPIVPLEGWLARRRVPGTRLRSRKWAGFAVGALIVVLGAVPSLADWRTAFPDSRMNLVRDRIEEVMAEAPSRHVVYVFGDGDGYEVESLRIAELEMTVAGDLRFQDLTTGEVRGSGSGMLLYGAIIPLLGAPEMIPGYCTNLYLVEPEVVDRFHAPSDAVAREECGEILPFVVLNV